MSPRPGRITHTYELDFNRQQDLLQRNAIATRDFESARAQLKVAEARVAEARELYAKAGFGPDNPLKMSIATTVAEGASLVRRVDRPGVRIDRFLEGLEIIKRAMTGEKFSFSGKHYTITDYTATPLPVQKPCPPILIGGGGPRVLKLAAQLADIVGINPSLKDGVVNGETIKDMSAEAVQEKIDIITANAGARLPDIELNIRTFLVNIRDSAQEAIEGTANMLKFDPTLVANSPFYSACLIRRLNLVGRPSKPSLCAWHTFGHAKTT